jgi:hypothetical protein
MSVHQSPQQSATVRQSEKDVSQITCSGAGQERRRHAMVAWHGTRDMVPAVLAAVSRVFTVCDPTTDATHLRQVTCDTWHRKLR